MGHQGENQVKGGGKDIVKGEGIEIDIERESGKSGKATIDWAAKWEYKLMNKFYYFPLEAISPETEIAKMLGEWGVGDMEGVGKMVKIGYIFSNWDIYLTFF